MAAHRSRYEFAAQSDRASRSIGWASLFGFLAMIPLANWMILHIGTVCAAGQPCLLPVFPGLLAPSGVVTVGAALVLRDTVQRCLGRLWGLGAIAAGAALSVLVAPASLVLASAVAFCCSELADFAVYTPLQRRRLVLAVFASATLGLLIDSIVFLWLAFGTLQFLEGQVVGKLWAVLVSLPFIRVLRRVVPSQA